MTPGAAARQPAARDERRPDEASKDQSEPGPDGGGVPQAPGAGPVPGARDAEEESSGAGTPTSAAPPAAPQGQGSATGGAASTPDIAASARAVAAALFGDEAGGDVNPGAEAEGRDTPPPPRPAAGRSLTALALARVNAEMAARQRPTEGAPATLAIAPPDKAALPPPDVAATGEATGASDAAAHSSGATDGVDAGNEAEAGASLPALAPPAPALPAPVPATPVTAPASAPDVALRTTPPLRRASALARTAALALWPAPRRLWWALPLVLVAVLVARLLAAPVTLPVAGLVADNLSAATGVPVTVERVRVRVGLGAVNVRVGGVRLATQGASVRLGEVRLSQGFTGRSVELLAPYIEVRLAGGPPPGLPRPEEAIARLDAALAELSLQADRAALRSVAVTGGRIDIVSPGAAAPTRRTFDAIEGTLGLSPGRLEAELSLLGASGLVSARLERTTDAAGTRISAAADGLVPADLGPAGAIRRGFRIAPVFEATLGPDGSVTSGTVAVGIGEGTVAFGKDPPRTLDEGHLQLSLGDGGLVVENTSFVAGGSRLDVAGTFTPGATADDPWRFRLDAPVALFDAPDIAKAPVDLPLLEAEGTIDAARQHIRVEALRAGAATGRLDAVLDFDITGGLYLSGAAHIGPSLIPTLLGAWPPVIAYDPRMAVMNTVLGGVVTSLDVELAMTPLEFDGDPETSDGLERTIVLDATFVDTTLTTPELPIAIQRARGEMKMLDRTLSVRLDGGIVVAGDAGELAVTDAYLTIQPLGANPATAAITATVTGPLAAVVELAERMNLPQLKENGLTPGDVSGTVEARLAMSTPLGDDVLMENREWSVDARLIDAASAKPLGGQTFADADIELLINPRRLAARGSATIDGIRVDVNYSELFAGEKSGGARFVLTDRDRRQRGFDTGDALRGPVVVTVDAAAGEATEGRAFTADLTEAEVTVPGLLKAAGQKLVAEGNLIGDGSDITVQNLRLDGSGVSVGGTISVDGEGLTAATLDPFALSRGDDARLAVERAGDGYRVWLNAAEFDARRIVETALNPPRGAEKAKPADLPPLTVSARGDRILLKDGAVLSNVELDAKRGKSRLETLSFSALVDGASAGSIAVRLAPEDGERALRGDVVELGRVLSALGIYDRMRRGRTTLDARISADGVMRGRLVVQDFALEGEETLEEIIARAQADQGRDPGARLLAFQATGPNDGGLAFERLRVDFTKEGDLVTIREANLRGPTLGGTADGVVDLSTGEMRLNGTLIPAYGVNNLFGRVPIVGEILGGGDKGGLIGVTFRVTGPMKSPSFAVNPLSAVAPGIFRRIFEFR